MASSPTPAHRASPVLIQPATFALRAAAQNASCALVNAPQSRACIEPVELVVRAEQHPPVVLHRHLAAADVVAGLTAALSIGARTAHLPGLPRRAVPRRMRRPDPAPLRPAGQGSRVPRDKWLADFDFDANPNINPATIHTLDRLRLDPVRTTAVPDRRFRHR